MVLLTLSRPISADISNFWEDRFRQVSLLYWIGGRTVAEVAVECWLHVFSAEPWQGVASEADNQTNTEFGATCGLPEACWFACVSLSMGLDMGTGGLSVAAGGLAASRPCLYKAAGPAGDTSLLLRNVVRQHEVHRCRHHRPLPCAGTSVLHTVNRVPN